MRCGDCANWRGAGIGQCRANAPLVLVVQARAQVIAAPGKNNAQSDVNFYSYWPPVGADEVGCGQFKPAFTGPPAARL